MEKAQKLKFEDLVDRICRVENSEASFLIYNKYNFLYQLARLADKYEEYRLLVDRLIAKVGEKYLYPGLKYIKKEERVLEYV